MFTCADVQTLQIFGLYLGKVIDYISKSRVQVFISCLEFNIQNDGKAWPKKNSGDRVWVQNKFEIYREHSREQSSTVGAYFQHVQNVLDLYFDFLDQNWVYFDCARHMSWHFWLSNYKNKLKNNIMYAFQLFFFVMVLDLKKKTTRTCKMQNSSTGNLSFSNSFSQFAFYFVSQLKLLMGKLIFG